MKNVISNNADFLFLYDAFQCNPNGDPDQENKPRMDYDTDTNLVTDTRVKRYVRDYLRHVKNEDIFVDMEGNSKVSPDTRLKNVITTLINDEARLNAVLPEDLKKIFNDLKNKTKDKTAEQIIKLMQGEKEKADKKDDKAKEDALKEDKKEDKSKAEIMRLNYHLLAHLVKDKFIDVRMFGSAFAIKGFTKSYTGPIQMNWGYSLHKVKIMDSSSIVTIMNDDNTAAMLMVLCLLNLTSLRRLQVTCIVITCSILVLAAMGSIAFHTGFMAEELVLRQNTSDDDEDEVHEEVQEYAAPAHDKSGRFLLRVRSLGFLNDPNDFAQAMVMVLPMLWWFYAPGRLLRNLFVVAAPGVLLGYAILLTQSRGALLGVAGLLLLASQRMFGWLKTSVMAAVVVGAVGIVSNRRFPTNDRLGCRLVR